MYRNSVLLISLICLSLCLHSSESLLIFLTPVFCQYLCQFLETYNLCFGNFASRYHAKKVSMTIDMFEENTLQKYFTLKAETEHNLANASVSIDREIQDNFQFRTFLKLVIIEQLQYDAPLTFLFRSVFVLPVGFCTVFQFMYCLWCYLRSLPFSVYYSILQ